MKFLQCTNLLKPIRTLKFFNFHHKLKYLDGASTKLDNFGKRFLLLLYIHSIFSNEIKFKEIFTLCFTHSLNFKIAGITMSHK